jgi:hypothetical protein
MNLGKSVLLIACLCAGTPAQAADRIQPFTSDGCSLFPDGTLRENRLWLSCCVEHDKRYWMGGTWQERLQADRDLRACVARMGRPEIADIMLGGVRVGGSPFWPTPFRWGYGWGYWRGYKPLSEPERRQIEQSLESSQVITP